MGRLENLNIPNNILLVARPLSKYSGTDMPQAFVVDPSNKKQYDSALRWARETITPSPGNLMVDLEPVEYLFENNGFTVELLDSAGESSQGGKLSFWNCIISKDDVRLVIGIDQDGLLALLKQSDMQRGVITEKCSLAKSTSTACVVHPGMEEYKSSKLNQINSNAVKKPKTSKWQIGKSYASLTKDELYLGKVYKWFEVTTEVVKDNSHGYGYGYGSNVMHYHLKLAENSAVRHCIMSITGGYNSVATKLENAELTKLSQLYNQITEEMKVSTGGLYHISYESGIYSYGTNDLIKLPARWEGSVLLENDTTEEDLNTFLFEIRSRALERVARETNIRMSDDLIQNIFGTTGVDRRPTFTEEDIQTILEGTSKTIHIDFGDGIERTGKRG